jgi:hypothetical protein
MKAKSLQHEPASPEVAVERRPFPRVAVVRRIDSKRPTRVWSLLLPPSFLNLGPKKPV